MMNQVESPQPGATIFPAEVKFSWSGEVTFGGKGIRHEHDRWNFFVNPMGDLKAVPVGPVK